MLLMELPRQAAGASIPEVVGAILDPWNPLENPFQTGLWKILKMQAGDGAVTPEVRLNLRLAGVAFADDPDVEFLGSLDGVVPARSRLRTATGNA